MQENKHTGFKCWMRDKGYYIVLVLCIAAVGISGYLYFNQSAVPDADAAQTASLQAEAEAETQENSDINRDENAIPQLMKPVDGAVEQSFATDHLAYNATTRDWRVHSGVDLVAETGQSVCAAADGTVSGIIEDDFMGWTVELTHADGYMTRYCNLAAQIPVEVGAQVTAGSVIGTVGDTAKLELAQSPHLHFEVCQRDTMINPELCFTSAQ